MKADNFSMFDAIKQNAGISICEHTAFFMNCIGTCHTLLVPNGLLVV